MGGRGTEDLRHEVVSSFGRVADGANPPLLAKPPRALKNASVRETCCGLDLGVAGSFLSLRGHKLQDLGVVVGGTVPFSSALAPLLDRRRKAAALSRLFEEGLAPSN